LEGTYWKFNAILVNISPIN